MGKNSLFGLMIPHGQISMGLALVVSLRRMGLSDRAGWLRYVCIVPIIFSWQANGQTNSILKPSVGERHCWSCATARKRNPTLEHGDLQCQLHIIRLRAEKS
jgi:hypothetical protein